MVHQLDLMTDLLGTPSPESIARVLKFRIFSLTSILPEEQKILVKDQNLIVTESFDLESISDKLRLVSIHDEQVEEKKELSLDQFEKSDEELARILQAEEEALFFQHYRASEDRETFVGRVRPSVKQVLMYEDPVRQEAACKSVPISEIEEKALVSLAKVLGDVSAASVRSNNSYMLISKKLHGDGSVVAPSGVEETVLLAIENATRVPGVEVNALLHSLDIDSDQRMRGPPRGQYPELEEYWTES